MFFFMEAEMETKTTETTAQRIARLDHEYDRVKRLQAEQDEAARKGVQS
jgi:hypothetical protein